MASLLELSRTVAAQSYTFWLCDNYDLVDNKPSISERKKEGCVCTEPDLIIAKTMLANFFFKKIHKKKSDKPYARGQHVRSFYEPSNNNADIYLVES